MFLFVALATVLLILQIRASVVFPGIRFIRAGLLLSLAAVGSGLQHEARTHGFLHEGSPMDVGLKFGLSGGILTAIVLYFLVALVRPKSARVSQPTLDRPMLDNREEYSEYSKVEIALIVAGVSFLTFLWSANVGADQTAASIATLAPTSAPAGVPYSVAPPPRRQYCRRNPNHSQQRTPMPSRFRRIQPK